MYDRSVANILRSYDRRDIIQFLSHSEFRNRRTEQLSQVSDTVSNKTRYSWAEYVLFPMDGKRHEVVNGDHYMNPAPSPRHQTVSRRLQYQLMTQIEMTGRGFVFNAPTDVEIAPYDIVQPDLIIVMNERKSIIGSRKLKGVPDLIVEILSESNPDYDRVLKFAAYERAGLPEYWIVDPEEKTIHQFVCAGGKLVPRGVHNDEIMPVVIADVRVSLPEVWE